MEIKVLGGGCSKCQLLEKHVRMALEELGLKEEVILIKDYKDIAAHGVMLTPAVIVNGEKGVMGRVATVKEITALLSRHIEKQADN